MADEEFAAVELRRLREAWEASLVRARTAEAKTKAMLHWIGVAREAYADNPDFLGALSAIEYLAIPRPLTEAEVKRGQEIEAALGGTDG